MSWRYVEDLKLKDEYFGNYEDIEYNPEAEDYTELAGIALNMLDDAINYEDDTE